MLRVLSIFVVILLFSCQDSESPTSCAVANSVADLPWLKELIKTNADMNLIEYFYLVQGTYKGTTVFSFLNCCPFCRTVPQILDCQGKVIDASLSDIQDQKTIWRPVVSLCT